MKFLVDNQLPKELARWLVSQGHDAEHVLDRGQGQTDDRQFSLEFPARRTVRSYGTADGQDN